MAKPYTHTHTHARTVFGYVWSPATAPRIQTVPRLMHSTCNKILVASVRERILLWSERLFFSSSLVDELDKKIPHGRIFFLIPPSVNYATTPGRKVNRGYLERCLSLISAQEARDKSTFFLTSPPTRWLPPTLPHPG